MTTEGKCPFDHVSGRGSSNRDWWPNALHVELLNQHGDRSDPMGEDFDYAKEFKSIDYKALKKDLAAVMTDSKPWWPADFGHYGPLMIRMYQWLDRAPKGRNEEGGLWWRRHDEYGKS